MADGMSRKLKILISTGIFICAVAFMISVYYSRSNSSRAAAEHNLRLIDEAAKKWELEKARTDAATLVTNKTREKEWQHMEQEKRSTEAEIGQHIVGEWACVDVHDCWYPTLIIAADGNLTGAQSDGKTELVGKWEVSHTMLRVNWTPDKLKAARTSGIPVNEWDYFPLAYVDDHELVMTPGISVSGRWRYRK
jgi:hypothetical protein